MRIVIVGNGVIGLQTARVALERFPQARIAVVGPRSRPGSASLAAAAMFNSFCEVEVGMLENRYERLKFDFNRAAAAMWPALLERLRAQSGLPVNDGYGTYIVNNTVSDKLEDENYDAIAAAMREYGEPYEVVDPGDIPFYKPVARARAVRAMYIPNEGWVNPTQLIAALDRILEGSDRVEFVDEPVSHVAMKARSSDLAGGVVTESGRAVDGDFVVLAPGANFSEIVGRSKLPVRFQRVFYGVGASLRIETGDNTLTNCIRTPNRGLACGTYASPQDATSIIVGASNFMSPVPVDAARLTSVLGLLEAAIDQINSDFYRAELKKVNVGWRPTTTDSLPMVGRSDISNLLVATGTRRDGLHCSPLIGEILSDLIAGRAPSFDVSAFKPDRAVVRTTTRGEAIDMLVRHTMNAAYQHGYQPSRTRMSDELAATYRTKFEQLHDQVGATDWGIPAAMVDMYRYGHVTASA